MITLKYFKMINLLLENIKVRMIKIKDVNYFNI